MPTYQNILLTKNEMLILEKIIHENIQSYSAEEQANILIIHNELLRVMKSN